MRVLRWQHFQHFAGNFQPSWSWSWSWISNTLTQSQPSSRACESGNKWLSDQFRRPSNGKRWMVSLQFDLESSWRLRVGVALPGRCCTPWQPRSRTEIDSRALFTTTIRAEQQQRTTKNNKTPKKIKKKPARKTQPEPNFNLNRLVLKLLRRITPSRSRSHSPSPNPIPHRPHQHRCRRSPTDSWKGGWNFVGREMEKLKTLAFLISAFFVFVSLFVAFFTHSTEIPNRSDSKTMFNVFIQVFPFVICLPRWNESEQ